VCILGGKAVTFWIKLSPTALAIADLVEYHPDGVRQDGFLITRINVPFEFRSKGHGSALLKKILAAADERGEKLWLGITPSDGLSFVQLERWYFRHGFKWVGKHTMMRKPKKGEVK